MKFPAHAVIGTSTGRLLGDIGGIYSVVSFLIGRPAFTHDLAYYGRRAESALKAALPDLPGRDDAGHVNGDNYRDCLAAWERQFGTEIDLPDTLRDCLADDKNPMETLGEMVDPSKIIAVRVDGD